MREVRVSGNRRTECWTWQPFCFYFVTEYCLIGIRKRVCCSCRRIFCRLIFLAFAFVYLMSVGMLWYYKLFIGELSGSQKNVVLSFKIDMPAILSSLSFSLVFLVLVRYSLDSKLYVKVLLSSFCCLSSLLLPHGQAPCSLKRRCDVGRTWGYT